MKSCSKILFIFLVAFTSCFSKSNQIYSIKEVLNHLDPTKLTLVIFDIDNTLLQPKTDLGSYQWFCHLIKENLAAGMDRSTALNNVLPIYFHVTNHVDLVPIEDTVAEDLKSIEQNCDRVICLTSRSYNVAGTTIEHLHNNNLKFAINHQENLVIYLPNPSIYKEGTLFCGSNDKVTVLLSFLDSVEYTPDVIVFVDDVESNLNPFTVALEKRNIEFIGLRYAGCDERVSAFNHHETHQELQQFLLHHPL